MPDPARPLGLLEGIVVAGGSLLGITGGAVAQAAETPGVASGGLMVGMGGILAAVSPVAMRAVQGYFHDRAEERKARLARHDMANKVAEAAARIEMLEAEKRHLDCRTGELIEALKVNRRILLTLLDRFPDIPRPVLPDLPGGLTDSAVRSYEPPTGPPEGEPRP